MWIEQFNTISRVTRATDEEVSWLSEYLSFSDKKAFFSGAPAKQSLLNPIRQAFPTGFLPMIAKACVREGFQLEVADRRVCPVERDRTADISYLRDYQLEAVDRVEQHKRGILHHGTGAGKSVTFSAITQAFPGHWLFFANRINLVQQMAAKYNQFTKCRARVIGDGKDIPGDGGLTCIQFDAIRDRLNEPWVAQLLASAVGMAVDECFVAGTLVDGRPIETLRVGDYVTAYSGKAFVQRRVLRMMKSKPSALVRVDVANGSSFVCTPEHQLLSTKGWVAAKDACGCHVHTLSNQHATQMRTVRLSNKYSHGKQELRRVLQRLHDCASESAAEGCYGSVCGVREASNLHRKEGARASAHRARLLLRRAQGSLDSSKAQRNKLCESNAARSKSCVSKANARAQSNEHARCQRDCAFGTLEEGRLVSKSTRWQRARNDCTAIDALQRSTCWGRCGVRNPNENEQAKRLPNVLQGRHSLRRRAASHRSRWGRSLQQEAPGRKEGCISTVARVDSVTRLEQDSAGTFGGMCSDDYVYNIEVAQHNNYTANGVVVHNCHTLPAQSYSKVIQACPAYYRVGLSATPLQRGDRRSILAIGLIGPIIHTVSAEKLIGDGTLARPTIKMLEIQHPPSHQGSWHGVKRDCITNSAARNAMLVRAIIDCEKPAMVFIHDIAHGKRLNKALQQNGVKTEFVHGVHGGDLRARYTTNLNNGTLEVLVASIILTAGQDIPEVRTVVIACGEKSVIEAIQRIGRGMRRTDGKDSFTVIDAYDKGCGCDQANKQMTGQKRFAHKSCKWLETHSKERMKAYLSEKHSVTVEQVSRR